MAKLTEQDMEDLLKEAITNASYDALDEGTFIEEFRDAIIRSFEDRGVLTTNKGLVIHLSTGEEFQVTIVRSR
jgi:hypothetical protein